MRCDAGVGWARGRARQGAGWAALPVGALPASPSDLASPGAVPQGRRGPRRRRRAGARQVASAPHLAVGQEARQVLLAGLQQHGQVAAVDDLQPQAARLLHQVPARRPAGGAEHAERCQARPGQARPGQARPGQARPGQGRPSRRSCPAVPRACHRHGPLQQGPGQPASLAAPAQKGRCCMPPHLKLAFSSGAPPVMSTVVTLLQLRISCTQRSAVARSIISVRFGELSTWQWVQAWLQYRPMLIWKTWAGERLSGAAPAAADAGWEGVGAAGSPGAARQVQRQAQGCWAAVPAVVQRGQPTAPPLRTCVRAHAREGQHVEAVQRALPLQPLLARQGGLAALLHLGQVRLQVGVLRHLLERLRHQRRARLAGGHPRAAGRPGWVRHVPCRRGGRAEDAALGRSAAGPRRPKHHARARHRAPAGPRAPTWPARRIATTARAPARLAAAGRWSRSVPSSFAVAGRQRRAHTGGKESGEGESATRIGGDACGTRQLDNWIAGC
jgi:hypothetical protein